MTSFYRKLCVATVASFAVLLTFSPSWADEKGAQDPATSIDPVYFDGAFVGDSQADAAFDLGYDLGAAFAGAAADGLADPDPAAGSSLVSLTPPDSGAEGSDGVVLVPWTSAADLAPPAGAAARSGQRTWGLAGLIKAARDQYEREGGKGGGMMRLDMTLDQVLTDLSWRKRVVETLHAGE